MKAIFPFKWNRFWLLDHIDSGGMADIYLAIYASEYNAPTRLLAVKRIKENYTSNREWKNMFRNEVDVALSLKSPNIVETLDFNLESGEAFIVMEYVDGVQLRKVFHDIETKSLNPSANVCVEIARQAALGLHAAHSHVDPLSGKSNPIVHRDMSPHNLLLNTKGTVKIIDFGIAKQTASSDATEIGLVKGKPSYMSPEQVRGERTLDGRSDVFALGIILWELLTHKRLFVSESGSVYALLKRVESREFYVQNPAELNPGVEKELGEIVLRALDRDREKRTSSAMELATQLLNYQNSRLLEVGETVIERFINEFYSEKVKKQTESIQSSLKKVKVSAVFSTISIPDFISVSRPAADTLNAEEVTQVSIQTNPSMTNPAVVSNTKSNIAAYTPSFMDGIKEYASNRYIRFVALTLIVYGASMFVVENFIVRKNVNVSEDGKWSQTFKKEFVSSCIDQGIQEFNQNYDDACECLASNVEKAKVIQPSYNALTTTQEQYVAQTAKSLDYFYASQKGQQAKQDCGIPLRNISSDEGQ